MNIIFFILGAFGFWVARHIYMHKHSEEAPLVCMVGFDCHTVVHSDYSKFLGIPVEILGMLYYGLVSVAYLSLIVLPFFFPLGLPAKLFYLLLPAFYLATVQTAFIGFLFSVYLIGVQAFALKNWCSWCVVSASITTVIFALKIYQVGFGPIIQIFTK